MPPLRSIEVQNATTINNNNYETTVLTNTLSFNHFNQRGGNNKILDSDVSKFGNFLSCNSKSNIISIASSIRLDNSDKRKTVNDWKKAIYKKLLDDKENGDPKSKKILVYLREKNPQKLSQLLT